MCADLLYRNIIKGKYIPNPPCFLRMLDMGGETVRFEKNETALVRLRVEF